MNRPFLDNLRPDERFKDAAELRDEYNRLLAGRVPVRVVHSCGSGVSARHNILAMKMIGFDSALTLYPGSWSELCSEPPRPIATGDEAGRWGRTNDSRARESRRRFRSA